MARVAVELVPQLLECAFGMSGGDELDELCLLDTTQSLPVEAGDIRLADG
jgi:hypothetical protein